MPCPFQLEFRTRGSELQVVIRGDERHPEDVLDGWRRIAAEVQRRHSRRLLAITHVFAEPMSVEDMRDFFGGMKGLGLEGIRIAYVDMSGYKTSLLEMAEIMASEYGFSARAFDNVIAAEIWLRHGGE